MTPANIVGMAALKNLDVIAVTDHNSCKNCSAVLKFAEENHMIAIPGMELCTMEEVHILCLFDQLENAVRFDEYVYSKLMKIKNKETIFGKQEIYNEMDERIGEEPYLLINAANISVDELDKLMEEYQGIYIPAHIDKNSNSLISNLGFVPPDMKVCCIELINQENKDKLLSQNPTLSQCNVIQNSDAHALGYIQEAIRYLEVEEISRRGVIEALKKSLYR